MKYHGHPAAEGHAPNCPNCGFWLESTDNCGAPVWEYEGHVLGASVVAGCAVGFFLGLASGICVGAIAYALGNMLFSQHSPLGTACRASLIIMSPKFVVLRGTLSYMFKPTPELTLLLIWPHGRRGLTWR